MPTYEQMGFGGGAALTGDRARSIFGQVMGLVGVSLVFTALGAYITRNLTSSGFMFWILGIACIFGLNFAVAKGREQLAIALLFGLGLFLGMSLGPVLNYYTTTNPDVVWQAAGTTAVGVALLGTIGYTTRRDLSGWARPLFYALIVGLVAGLVLMLVNIPGGDLIWSIALLIVFGGYTIFDFNRLAKKGQYYSPVLIAASIYLDILNIFLLLLNIFGGGGRR